MLINLLIFILVGIAVGFLAGLFGIGGGMIIVPALVYLLPNSGVPSTEIMHVAAGTSLASIILTLTGAVLTHLKHKTIQWPIFFKLVPSIIIGSILGAYATSQLPTHFLKILFGIFMFLMAIHMTIAQTKEQQNNYLPSLKTYSVAGFMIGFLSALLGIGGAAISVPILLRFNLTIHKATATSLACALLPCIIGTIVFILTGLHIANLPKGSMGFVYLPAAVGIAVCAYIFIPLGVKLAQNLSHIALKRGFAIYLILVGIDMLLF